MRINDSGDELDSRAAVRFKFRYLITYPDFCYVLSSAVGSLFLRSRCHWYRRSADLLYCIPSCVLLVCPETCVNSGHYFCGSIMSDRCGALAQKLEFSTNNYNLSPTACLRLQTSVPGIPKFPFRAVAARFSAKAMVVVARVKQTEAATIVTTCVHSTHKVQGALLFILL